MIADSLELDLATDRLYGELVFDKTNNRWVIEKAEPHVCLRLKKIFPKIAITSTPPFTLPNTLDTAADLHWVLQRYPMAMNYSDRQKLEQTQMSFYNTVAERERILMPNWTPKRKGGFKENKDLRKYQWQFVELYESVKSLLNGDEIGLGKSYEMIGSCVVPGTLPALVVVEPHLQIQWRDKIEEFSHYRPHMIKATKPYDLPEADIYIIKYSQLAGWVDVFQMEFFKSIHFDEVQQLRRGIESLKGQAAKVACQYLEHRAGYSGTPIYNYGNEIHSIYHHFLKPGALGDEYEFKREWCTGSDNRIVTNPKALGTYLRENHLFLRRTRKELGRELPPVDKVTEFVNCSQEDVKATQELAKELAIKTITGNFQESGMAAREFDKRLRHATGVGKARSVAAFTRMVVESGKPVVLVGWHRDVYEIWLKELADFNPVLYTGSESPKQKEQTKQSFINGESKIMILSLRSGAGMDGIQNTCSTVIFGELDWSGQIHDQVIGRVDREAEDENKESTLALFLVTDWGSDPVMAETLGLKRSQFTGIVDPLQGAERNGSDKTRIKEMAEDFLKASGVKVA